MKKICICGPFPEPVGGVSMHIRRLGAALNVFFDFEIIDESPLKKPGIFNIRCFNFFKYVQIIFSSDLVHVNSSVSVFRLLHVFFSRILGKPVLVTVHSFRNANWLNRVFDFISFVFASKIVVVSHEISSRFRFDHVVIPAFIKPSSADFYLSEFFSDLVKKIRHEGKGVVVSNAYRLDFLLGKEIYGFSDLIHLFRDSSVSDRYSIILNVSSLDGCSDVFDGYLKLIKDNCLENSVYLYSKPLNFVGLLKVSDVFIRATVTDGDALSVRESLMLDVKTIASDCVVRPAGTITYETGDISSLKNALLCSHKPEATIKLSFESDVMNMYRKLL